MNKDENQKVSQGLVAAFEHDCRLFGLLSLPRSGALEECRGGDCGERRLRPTHADFLHVDLDILPHPTSRHATQRVAMVAAGFSGWHSGFALSPASNGGRRNQPSLSAKHDALFPLPNRDCCGCGDCQTGWNRWLADAYTMLINLMAAVLISAFVPLVNPAGELSFGLSFWMIIKKVFPLLIFPLFLALIIRRISPTLLRWLTSIPDLPFYLWLVSLSLAIAVTTRILVHARVSWLLCLLILTGSLVACIMQFAVGRLVGRHYGEAVTAGQACGQKNTVLAIWVGYTFLDPLTSVAGGFYTIWHNVFNAWQLYQKNKPNHSTRHTA